MLNGETGIQQKLMHLCHNLERLGELVRNATPTEPLRKLGLKDGIYTSLMTNKEIRDTYERN